MTNRKTTKRALFTSTLALLMCVAMLIGTTFAWFTDTASTNVNKVQAGNLDVDLQVATQYELVQKEDGTFEFQNISGWESVDGRTLNFIHPAGHEDEPILWEPGCTHRLAPLRVINNGNLALKYKVSVTGINGDAKLNEAIDWLVSASSYTGGHIITLQPGAMELFAVKGHMREDAGNEYQGLSIDGISITVSATQGTAEYDSFSEQYDANATIPIVNLTASATAEDISAKIDEALASGTDTLTLNVNAAEGATAEDPSTVTLNANTLAQIDNLTLNLGENVVLKSEDHSRGETDIRDRFSIKNGKTLTITGEGAVAGDYFMVSGGGTLIIDNVGGFVQNSLGNAAINIAPHGANVVIKNQVMDNTYSVHPLISVGDGISLDNGETAASKLTLENVTMKNFYYPDSGDAVVGGVGIKVFSGSIDIITNNVTFNGFDSNSSNVVFGTSSNDAFLLINSANGASATLNGAEVVS